MTPRQTAAATRQAVEAAHRQILDAIEVSRQHLPYGTFADLCTAREALHKALSRDYLRDAPTRE